MGAPAAKLGGVMALPAAAEVLAFDARLTVPLQFHERFQYSRMVAAIKAAGAWDKFDAFWMLAAPTEQAMKFNLVGTSYTLTTLGGYTFSANIGWKGNGSSGYMTTGLTLTAGGIQWQRENAWMAVWQITDTGNSGIEAGANGGGPIFALRTRVNISGAALSNAASAVNIRARSGANYMSQSRTGSTVTINKAGSITSTTQATTGTPTNPFQIGRIFNGGTYSPNRLSLVAIGRALTQDEDEAVRLAVGNFLLFTGAITSLVTEPETIGPNYFTPAMIADIDPPTWEVMHQMAPPEDDTVDETTFSGFPANGVMTGSITGLKTSADNGMTIMPNLYYFQWCNRWHDPTATVSGGFPNWRRNTGFSPGIFTTADNECGVEYTSLAKADAATKTIASYLAGNSSATYEAIATAAGFSVGDIYTYAAASAAADSLFTLASLKENETSVRVARDIIVLPQYTLGDTDCLGVYLDTEMGDGRTPAELVALVTDLHTIYSAAGYTLNIWNNGLGTGGADNSGFDATSIAAIQSLGVPVSIFGWRRTNSQNMTYYLDEQAPYFAAANWPLVHMIFQLQDATTEDATLARAYMLEKGMTRVTFYRGGATIGGEMSRQVNQCIATLLGLPTS